MAKKKKKREVGCMDALPENQDWTKVYWDLPPYKSEEFFKLWPLHKLDDFRKLPVYKFAVMTGVIKDDEWQGYEKYYEWLENKKMK